MFEIQQHKVEIPILPFQVAKLQQLATGLARAQMPPNQFCHKLGGYPLLIKVQSADPDMSLLYGGVWSVKLNCSVFVFRPQPGGVIEATCTDVESKRFTLENYVKIVLLQPKSKPIRNLLLDKFEKDQTKKLVILGLGNSKPILSVERKQNLGRRQPNTIEPQPILYARLETDPEDEDEYPIPYGKFELDSKSVPPSTKLSKEEAAVLLQITRVQSKVPARNPHGNSRRETPDAHGHDIDSRENRVDADVASDEPKKKKKKKRDNDESENVLVNEDPSSARELKRLRDGATEELSPGVPSKKRKKNREVGVSADSGELSSPRSGQITGSSQNMPSTSQLVIDVTPAVSGKKSKKRAGSEEMVETNNSEKENKTPKKSRKKSIAVENALKEETESEQEMPCKSEDLRLSLLTLEDSDIGRETVEKKKKKKRDKSIQES